MKKIILTLIVILSVFFVSCGGSLSNDDIKDELTKIVGTTSAWKMDIFKDLKLNMSCEDVKAIYSDIECNSDEEWDFQEAKYNDSTLIDAIEFDFYYGKLESATVMIKSSIDKETFKDISLEVLEAKWGALEEEEKGEEILTWVYYGDSFFTAQRTYMVDHWEIDCDFDN